MNPTGLKSLYEKTNQLNLNHSSDIKNLTEITTLIRSWHHSTMPKYSLNLFLDKCRAFGTNNKFLGYHLQKMRKVHKG
jgi:hypothetical protein